MTLEQMNLEESLEIDLEDRLSDLTADLVALESNSAFLARLFSLESGKWVDLEPLCSELNEIRSEIAELKKSFQGTIRVTWLDYPDAEGFCTIVFFVAALHWSNLALYNQQLFFKRFYETTSTSA
ncbi:hypothetical protein ACE1CD_03725 [Aerosakkonema sp. BLCC-F183]|uniref:hypothetical protein n=1 Tax=Aerosakkonema sp. BLCC-F183 TaxID=3342834 RepID=UPI0035B7C284